MNKSLALQADLPTLRQHLRMAFVLEHYGHYPDNTYDGKLHYHSPFRNDQHPSFDVFKHLIAGRTEPEERYGDFADPTLKQGDVVDLIQLFRKQGTSDAIMYGRELLVEQLESGWTGPEVKSSEYKVLDMSTVDDLIARRKPLGLSDQWQRMFRTHPGLTEVVLPEDRVFRHPDSDILVFLLLDEVGGVRGVRHRTEDGRKYGLSGGHNILMRLEEPSNKPVFLVEGETDTWAAWAALKDEYEVLGVPGVSNQPEKTGAQYLAGRTVFIAFDPDEAGADGRALWASYLHQIGCDIRTIIVPEGRDIAGMHQEAIKKLPDRARAVPPAPEGFTRHGDTFATVGHIGRGDDRVETYSSKSNWAFTPEKILVAEDGSRTYQGILHPHNLVVKLPDVALSSSNQLKSWGRPHTAYWSGSDPQVQQLAMWLAHEAAFLPEGRIHNQVGLYEGSFVWPDGYIGDQPVEFLPTVAEAKLGPDEIFIKRADIDPVLAVATMLQCQNTAVTGPVLAWLAAAPLRTRFSHFPSLNVTGLSGSGKTELTRALLEAFTSTSMSVVLSSATRHAVSTMIDNSNGFPVWFDEYRPGANSDAKQQLDQLLRDAWTMQESAKGGQDRTNLSKLSYIRTAAPIIVTGEDTFTETSHTDRMMQVRLYEREQGDLVALQDFDMTGFAHAYLTWLTSSQPGYDPTPPVWQTFTVGGIDTEGLRPRQAQGARVLQIGWALLQEFLETYNPAVDLGELNLSRVVETAQEDAKTDPTAELLQNLLERSDLRQDTVWRYQGDVCIHVTNCVSVAKKEYPGIQLPSENAKGLKMYLATKYDIDTTRETFAVGMGNKRVRAVRVPEDLVEWLSPTDDKEPHEHHPEI